MTALIALAVADFRERVRRPAFAGVLLGAVALGYAAVPPASASYAMLRVGAFRGVYEASYVGTAVALVGGVWLSLAGFYVTKNAVARDDTSGVGQILAATALRRPAYLFGKFLSNLAVLLVMTAVLAVTALVMVVARGEQRDGLDLVPLFLPFLLFSVPVMAVGAAGALVFETVAVLRGAAGNVLWFFGWIVAVAGATARVAGLDLLGFASVAESMQSSLLRQHPGASDTDLSAGLVIEESPAPTFHWSGLDITADLVAGRLVIVAFAVIAVAVAAAWFNRFDSNGRPRRSPSGAVEPVKEPGNEFAAYARPPRTPVVARPRLGVLVIAELRLLLGAVRWWWWLCGLALAVTAVVVPTKVAVYPLLPLCWLWPIAAWSRLGAQRYEHGAHPLVDAAPSRHRRLAAEWTAGLALTAVAGAGPLVRLAAAADGYAVLAWCAGAVLIPTLALGLGLLSRTQRLFQAAYLMLWYAVFNRTPQVDFMGVTGTDQVRGSVLVLATTAVLAAATMLVQQLRHAAR